MFRRVLLVALLGLLAITWPAAPAAAKWTASSTGSATAKATTPAAPTTFTATCFGALSTRVKLDWSASSTTWVTGYEVQWGTTQGSPTATSGTQTGLTFTTPSLGLGTYYFTVRSLKGAWLGATVNSTPLTRTALALACL